jgi:hypothetical protein
VTDLIPKKLSSVDVPNRQLDQVLPSTILREPYLAFEAAGPPRGSGARHVGMSDLLWVNSKPLDGSHLIPALGH